MDWAQLDLAAHSSMLQLEKMKLVLNARIFPRDLIGGFVSLPCNSGTAARTKPMGINCKKALKATEASHCLPDLKPQDSLLPEEDKQQLTTIYNRAALKLTGCLLLLFYYFVSIKALTKTILTLEIDFSWRKKVYFDLLHKWKQSGACSSLLLYIWLPQTHCRTTDWGKKYHSNQ